MKKQDRYFKLVSHRLEEVANWIQEKITNPEIAKLLGISESTLYEYKKRHSEFNELFMKTCKCKKGKCPEKQKVEHPSLPVLGKDEPTKMIKSEQPLAPVKEVEEVLSVKLPVEESKPGKPVEIENNINSYLESLQKAALGYPTQITKTIQETLYDNDGNPTGERTKLVTEQHITAPNVDAILALLQNIENYKYPKLDKVKSDVSNIDNLLQRKIEKLEHELASKDKVTKALDKKITELEKRIESDSGKFENIETRLREVEEIEEFASNAAAEFNNDYE